jgi:Fe2+ or Zn2+ uptake regulation protein
MKTAEIALNERGLKVTSQRMLILETIRRSHGHVDADEVFLQIRKKLPRISLSTVYRTLQRFKELGLIDELHFAEEHHHYELKPATEHYHLICMGCGRVTEFHFPLHEVLKKQVPEARDFEISGSEVTLTGYCQDCRESKKG